jgi:lipopolysaccharide/colanic/teichoic acid biosynthesis glycosyltransferase
MKRAFDVVASLLALVLLSPVLLVIAGMIFLKQGAPVLFKQERVGLNGRRFAVLKFRTMINNAEQSGQLTTSGRDPRITKMGHGLRKYKLDELPQLINVLLGQMSIVGPRPEVPKYVDLYTDEQREVLSVKPGITDLASIEFIDENELLGGKDDPEEHYVNVVLPQKLNLQLRYVRAQSFANDLVIILKTVRKIIR